MYGVQLSMMNCRLASEKKPINMIGSAKFLQFSNHHIRVVSTGTRLKRGAEFGLEIPLDYIFYEDSRVTTWLKKALEKVYNSINNQSSVMIHFMATLSTSTFNLSEKSCILLKKQELFPHSYK